MVEYGRFRVERGVEFYEQCPRLWDRIHAVHQSLNGSAQKRHAILHKAPIPLPLTRCSELEFDGTSVGHISFGVVLPKEQRKGTVNRPGAGMVGDEAEIFET